MEFNLFINPFAPTPPNRQPVKHTQEIRRSLPTNCLSVFDHFVGVALQGVRNLYFFNLFPKSEVNGVSWAGERGEREGGFNADIAIWSSKLCVQILKKLVL